MSPLLLALLLAAPDFNDPQVKLPSVPGGTQPDNPSHPALIINLTAEGEVRADPTQAAFGDRISLMALKQNGVEPGVRTMTLDELGVHLDRAKRLYQLHQRVKGKPGVEKVGGMFPRGYSPLFVTIRADREAPWEHIEWLMTICAEQSIYKTQLAVLSDGKEPAVLPAFLPKDGPDKDPKEPALHRVRVTVALHEQATDTRLVYSHRYLNWDEAWSGPLGREGLRAWLLKADDLKNNKAILLVGEIKASNQVPLHKVASVLCAFRAVGFEHVHVYGGRLPDPDRRKLKKLPYPTLNEVPRSVRGTAGFGRD